MIYLDINTHIIIYVYIHTFKYVDICMQVSIIYIYIHNRQKYTLIYTIGIQWHTHTQHTYIYIYTLVYTILYTSIQHLSGQRLGDDWCASAPNFGFENPEALDVQNDTTLGEIIGPIPSLSGDAKFRNPLQSMCKALSPENKWNDYPLTVIKIWIKMGYPLFINWVILS